MKSLNFGVVYRGIFFIATEFWILKSLENEVSLVSRFFQKVKNPYYPQKYSYFGRDSEIFISLPLLTKDC